MSSRCSAALAAALTTAIGVSSVQAQTPSPVETGPAENPKSTDIWSRANLFGDIGGVRTALGNVGITLGLTEVSEVLGNSRGGLKQGATYDGLSTLAVQMDTQKAFGWDGGLFNVSGLQIHGRNLNQFYTAALQAPSGIEAAPTTRLWELWYQQGFWGGKADVKVGLQSVDQDFLSSTTGAAFVNLATGFPIVPSYDLYAGGPAYPLSSLGARVRYQVADAVTVLAGVFQDNPPGGPFNNDSQLRGSSRIGANFSLRTGALFIGELQYAANQPPVGDAPKPAGLPFSAKLGGYYDTARFADQRIDSAGGPLAAPGSTGVARMRRGNGAVYGVLDAGVWRPAADQAAVVSVFSKVLGAPGDRNLIDFSIVSGVTLKAPLPGRDDDTFGVAYGYSKISDRARGFDQDQAAYGATPVRSSEQFIEVTYIAQVTPWLQLQPDFQYIVRPSGGIANPYSPGKRIGDEAIFGVRTGITF